MPRPDNAIFALSRAMAKLADYETPVTAHSEHAAVLHDAREDEQRRRCPTYFRDLDRHRCRAARSRADREISKDPLLHAIMRNTIAPVIMNAGFRSNVIPGSAAGDDQRADDSRHRSRWTWSARSSG